MMNIEFYTTFPIEMKQDKELLIFRTRATSDDNIQLEQQKHILERYIKTQKIDFERNIKNHKVIHKVFHTCG